MPTRKILPLASFASSAVFSDASVAYVEFMRVIVAEIPRIAHRQNVLELESHVLFLVISTDTEGRGRDEPIMIYTRESRLDSGLWNRHRGGERMTWEKKI